MSSLRPDQHCRPPAPVLTGAALYPGAGRRVLGSESPVSLLHSGAQRLAWSGSPEGVTALVVCVPLGQEQSLESWQLLEKGPSTSSAPFQSIHGASFQHRRVRICAHWTSGGAGMRPARAATSTPGPGPWTSCFWAQSSHIIKCTRGVDSRVPLARGWWSAHGRGSSGPQRQPVIWSPSCWPVWS